MESCQLGSDVMPNFEFRLARSLECTIQPRFHYNDCKFPSRKKKLLVFPVGRLLSPTFCNADLFHLSFIFVGWVLFSGNEHGRTTKPSNFGVQNCWRHFLVSNSLCVFPFGLFAQCEKMLPSKKTEHFQVFPPIYCIILHFYMCHCFHIH